MRKMSLFMMISLDGFMEGANHDLSWHNVDEEFNIFAAEEMQDTGTIVMGRRTYQLMEDYWPTAKPEDPSDVIVAKQMNMLPKIVYSKTLQKVEEKENWKNVKLLYEVDVKEIEKLKKQPGGKISVLGSNNLCITLLEKGLLDELRIMINPVVLGKGTLLFEGIKNKLNLKLIETKVFKNGNMLFYYRPLQISV